MQIKTFLTDPGFFEEFDCNKGIFDNIKRRRVKFWFDILFCDIIK